MSEFKKYYLLRVVVSALFGVLLGVAFLLLRPYAGDIVDVLIIALGLLTVLLNLLPLFFSLYHIREKGEWLYLLFAVIGILLGVALMLLREKVLLLIVGVFSVLLPIVRVLTAHMHKEQFRRELPRVLAGLVMIVIVAARAEELAFFITAIACFALSAIYLLVRLLWLKFAFTQQEQPHEPEEK